MYRVEVSKSASKFFRKAPEEHAVRVYAVLEELGTSPRRGDRHLKGEYYCLWRRRVGIYRVIYKVYEKERRVVVVEICIRKQCY